eukprot:2413825-Pyramimonas_sp.AAC.1
MPYRRGLSFGRVVLRLGAAAPSRQEFSDVVEALGAEAPSSCLGKAPAGQGPSRGPGPSVGSFCHSYSHYTHSGPLIG